MAAAADQAVPQHLDSLAMRRQELMTVTFPGKEPITGIVTWVAGPCAAPDAPVTPSSTSADGTVISYSAIDR